MYDFIAIEGRIVEVCDECGFNGAGVDADDVPARLDGVRLAWSGVFRANEHLLRARPAPATWCAVEYSEHTAVALAGVEWAAREFLAGRAPDWSLLPPLHPPDATAENHDCASVGIDEVLEEVDRAAASLASFSMALTEADLEVTQLRVRPHPDDERRHPARAA